MIRKCRRNLLILVLLPAMLFGQTRKRTTQDIQDDDPGAYQVHLIYALASDSVDKKLDTNGAIMTLLSADQLWFETQTASEHVRIDTSHGVADITFVHLTRTNAQLSVYGAAARDAIEAELYLAGFNKPNKVYWVFAQVANSAGCGEGPSPLGMGSMGILFLDGTPPGAPPCNSNPVGIDINHPGYWGFAAAHDLVHTFGFVQPCAPNYSTSGSGHVSDSPTDLMYAGSEPWQYATGLVLDWGHDDYFDANNPGCPDLSNSVFWEPSVAQPQLPSGWPYGTLKNQGTRNIGSLKSVSFSTPTRVQFINGRCMPVKIYWISYNGVPELITALGPKQEFTENTFATQPWLVTNSNNQPLAVYLPTAAYARALITE